MSSARLQIEQPAPRDAVQTSSLEPTDPDFRGDPAWTNLSIPPGWTLWKFAGRWDDYLNNWEAHTRQTFIKCQVNPSVWPMLASFQLEGQAQLWWKSHMRELHNASWDEFIAQLKMAFRPRLQQNRIAERFETLKFGGSYDAYNTYFASLVAVADPDRFDYLQLEMYYLAPLPPSDQLHFTKVDLTTVEQLYVCSTHLARMAQSTNWRQPS